MAFEIMLTVGLYEEETGVVEFFLPQKEEQRHSTDDVQKQLYLENQNGEEINEDR